MMMMLMPELAKRTVSFANNAVAEFAGAMTFQFSFFLADICVFAKNVNLVSMLVLFAAPSRTPVSKSTCHNNTNSETDNPNQI